MRYALLAAASMAAAGAAGYAGGRAALDSAPQFTASHGFSGSVLSGNPLPAKSLPASAPDLLPGPYAASVLRIIDGDTFEARLRVWFGQDVTVAVRIRGFDAPERNGRCAREAILAQEAEAALADVLASGPLILREVGRDKYNGRIVASVEAAKEDVAALMVAGGYGRPYDGRARKACLS